MTGVQTCALPISQSGDSEEVTFATVPTPPQSLTASYGSGKITVNWSASASNGGSAITGYSAWIQSGSGDEGKKSCVVSETATACELTNLPKKGSFVVHAVARNAIGSSDDALTSEVTITGSTQTYTAPTTIPDKYVGDADFVVNAKVDSGLTLTYAITSGSAPYCSITSRGKVHVIAVGRCNITINQNGHKSDEHGEDKGEESEYEPMPEQTTGFNILDRLPSTPTITRVTPGNGTLALTWSAPSSAGGVPTGYHIQFIPVSSCSGSISTCTFTETTTVSSGTTYSQTLGTGTPLTNGSPYYIRIRAFNGTGTSAWVNGASTYTPITVPSAPVFIKPFTTYPETSTVTLFRSEEHTSELQSH